MVKKITKDIFRFYDEKYYNIFFILARELTDISDKQNTIDAFIESGYLPLTIIIIGEGKNNFESMKELFGKKIVQSSNGMLKNRDNIIFMNFSDDFNENSELLSEWCLREISKQMLSFYDLAKCNPEQIKKNNIGNIRNSINVYKQSYALYESKIIGVSQIENQQFKLSKKPMNNNQDKNYLITPDKPFKADIQPKNIYQGNKPTLVFNNIQKNQNNNIKGNAKMEIYKITPGQSVREEIDENPYVKKEPETPTGEYIIPKQNSICLDFKSNPYKDKIVIPQESANYHLNKNNNKLNNHIYVNNDKTNMMQKNRINDKRKPNNINTNNINERNNKPLGK
jgi:hypothetical protein